MMGFPAAVGRVQHADEAMKLGALAGAAIQALLPEAFFWLFLLLVASNVADWLFGRHAACAPGGGGFDRAKSRSGLVSKSAQLTILLLLRGLEAIIPLTGLPSTMGIGSAALCLALIVEDLESIERHSITLGGAGVPGLSPILQRVRAVTGGDRRNPDRPIPPSGQGRRRRQNDPPNHVNGEAS